MATYNGDSGDNDFLGTADGDTFNMQGGGEDIVQGDGGDDTIFFDAGLDSGDHIDGGDGSNDILWLSGNYSAGLVFTDTTVVNVEAIQLAAGHSYDLTLAAGTAVDGTLLVQTLGVGDHVQVDASAFTAGHDLQFNANQSVASVIGGAGNDLVSAAGLGGAVVFNGNGGDDTAIVSHFLTHADRFDGSDGFDTLYLTVVGDCVFTGKMLKHIESLDLADNDNPESVTMADGNLASGQTLTVNPQSVQSLTFDGSAERSGSFNLFGNAGGDTLTGGGGSDSLNGGSGDDVLTGGKGGDMLTGGDGDDGFIFTKLSDSGHHKLFDLIFGLQASDLIDLSAIDANSAKAGDQAFHLVDSFTGHAGELMVSYDADKELTTVAGDANGDGRADIAFHIAADWTGFEGWVL